MKGLRGSPLACRVAPDGRSSPTAAGNRPASSKGTRPTKRVAAAWPRVPLACPPIQSASGRSSAFDSVCPPGLHHGADGNLLGAGGLLVGFALERQREHLALFGAEGGEPLLQILPLLLRIAKLRRPVRWRASFGRLSGRALSRRSRRPAHPPGSRDPQGPRTRPASPANAAPSSVWTLEESKKAALPVLGAKPEKHGLQPADHLA